MPTGKAVNLKVRPLQAADLCFPADGIIEFLPGETLGTSVPGYSLSSLYDLLGTTEGDPGKLKWNAGAIFAELSPRAVARLRAEPAKVDIDNAVAMRQNAFLTTYSAEVVNWARRTYHSDQFQGGDAAVWVLLLNSWLAQWSVWSSLQKAYNDDKQWGPVKKVHSESTYSSIIKDPMGNDQYTNTAASRTDAAGYEYRYPYWENDARYYRGSANARQEFFNAIRMREKCKFGDITFSNELASLDREIKKLQVSYIDTFLVAPFAGVVTGIFANEGDFVSSGQPVLRLENDTSVFLVGTIKYRGLLKVGDQLSVTTTLFDAEGGTPTEIEGTVAAVRGHDSVDEQWDILVRCKNRTAAGAAIVPVNYNFDFESTTIEVVTV